MKIVAIILSILLGSFSFALAQSSGGAGGAKGGSPGTSAGQGSAPPSSNGVQGTTGSSQPTNSIYDNRVKRDTGNPLLPKGPVK